ncbi:uncharacterized protein LOC120627070 [Pararge aegeria]|uniref:uncharacterized protein LOC120627070 n=1 Tax=Pararge aegeria TaxID=116150 RepID=UPI0019D2CEA6|nr:uncharacterized protein LOC120627070 [Pararge aegeria]
MFVADLQSEGIFAEALNEGKLPPKSRERYVTVYENFTIWKNTANIKSFSEHVFLAYFEELAKKYKASTLWCIYSMLKATVKARDGVDIKNYSILVNYIKKLSLGFTKTKVKTLSVEQIQKFLREAPDLQYLVTKVVLIFIITGRCRTLDLTEITTKDIEDRDLQTPEIFVKTLSDGNLPPTSKERYVRIYDNFTNWKNSEDIKSLSEHVFLAYFEELAKKYKPSTLWCIYSMLKATVKARHDVDLKSYNNLFKYLKRLSIGFTQTKVKILSPEHIEQFLHEAPDLHYLVTKVVLIFTITGAVKTLELTEITTKDIKDHGDMYIVKITNRNNKTVRTFTIHGQLYKIVKKYELLRTPKAKNDRFFQKYQKGKCSCQPIGKNKFGSMAVDIATYLGLPDPGSYTSHSLRRKKTFKFSVQ